MKCFNGSKDVAQPEAAMPHFRHGVRLLVFLVLPRNLEWQQHKGIDTRDKCRDQMCQESFSHNTAAYLQRRNNVITDQMGKNKLLVAHSKRITRICEMCLVMLKGRAKGRGQSGSGRYQVQGSGEEGHERVWLSVRMLL